MKIFIASDHAGFQYKEQLKDFIRNLGHEVRDEGAFTFDREDDYPDFIKIVAKQVSSGPDTSRGIILGGSGQGEAMVANRYKNVRAVVYYGDRPSLEESLTGEKLSIIGFSREHNNANVLSIGARFVTLEEAKNAIKDWLLIPFDGNPRHLRRIQKIDNLVKEENSF